MGFENCSICDSLIFDKEKGNLCTACYEIESANIKKITEYFKSFEQLQTKTFSMEELSSATGIELYEIERLYRTNKLRSYTSIISLNCKICGNKFKPTIFSGVCCKNCTTKVEKVANELKESDKLIEKTEFSHQSSMYIKKEENKGFRFK